MLEKNARCLSELVDISDDRRAVPAAGIMLDMSAADWVWVKHVQHRFCAAAGAFWLTMAQWQLTVLSTARLQFSCCRLTFRE